MLICTVRATTLKLVSVFVLFAVCLVTVVLLMLPLGGETVPSIALSGVKTEEDRQAFLKEAGAFVTGNAVEVAEFTVPADFDRVLLGYNEIQKSQGFDLSRYAKKTVTRYTYEGTDPRHEGKVFVNLIVYRDKVVAADVTCAEGHDFVAPLLWEK